MANNENMRKVTCEFPPHAEHNGNDNWEAVNTAWKALKGKSCAGAEMTDWLHWPEKYLNSAEYNMLKKTIEEIYRKYEAIVFVGIGGSYLTGKMFTDIKGGELYNSLYGGPKCYFLGYDMDASNLEDVLSELENCKDWAIVYISKSGGTFEPAAAFNILYSNLLKDFSGNKGEANKRVYAITDAEKGILKNMANENGWTSFVIPDGIGGRFSGLTPVGLMPFGLVNGVGEMEELLLGAQEATYDCYSDAKAFAFQYAEWRLRHNHAVEYLATNSARLTYLVEWMKQLFGETEGKEGKGIFPTSGVFPRDLHSLGQFLQEGLRGLIFETQIISPFAETNEGDYVLEQIPGLKDGLDKFYGRTLAEAGEAAMHGAYVAHTKGGNPCGIIRFDAHDSRALGYFMQSMFISAAICAIVLGVNPFDQPGVELHKQVMKETLANLGNE